MYKELVYANSSEFKDVSIAYFVFLLAQTRLSSGGASACECDFAALYKHGHSGSTLHLGVFAR